MPFVSVPAASPEAVLETTATAAALASIRSAQWRPGLAAEGQKVLHGEVFGSSRDAAACGAALALALDDWLSGQSAPKQAREVDDPRSILWVQTRGAARLTGLPYRPGLPAKLSTRIIHVLAATCEDALFALEEGLRCRDLAFVIGEIDGNPRALDFTASRRLSLAASKHGVPLWLVRQESARDLSSARMRWQVASAPSPLPDWNPQAPGPAAWRAELFRSRSHVPGEWLLIDGNTGITAHAWSSAAEAMATIPPNRSA